MRKIPVIIDCDPGVDDSYAIALANSCPDYDIIAITPVEGNVAAAITRQNALCLSEMLGIDCKVAFGADKPLRKPYDRDGSRIHGQSGVGSVVFSPPKKQPDAKPAWEVIYDEAVKAQGKLLLFALGPLTNIATALRLHPDLPEHVDKFCIMGGGTFGNITDSAEFNIWVDPTAAKEVFEKMEVYMVGLDATHASALTGADFDEMIEICGDKESTYLLRELSKFSKKRSIESGCDNNIIHDAVAVASMMNPDTVTFEDYYVYVEDDDGAENVGETVVDLTGASGKPANCHVAMKANQPLFKGIIKDMFRYYSQRTQKSEQ